MAGENLTIAGPGTHGRLKSSQSAVRGLELVQAICENSRVC